MVWTIPMGTEDRVGKVVRVVSVGASYEERIYVLPNDLLVGSDFEYPTRRPFADQCIPIGLPFRTADSLTVKR
jgi:hypothetical protein